LTEYDISKIKVVKFDSMSQLLRHIQQHPYYVGGKSLRELNIWLEGFFFGRMVSKASYGDESFRDDIDFSKFDSYIQELFKMKDTAGWEKKISYYSGSDEEAFDSFFRHLELFLKKTMI